MLTSMLRRNRAGSKDLKPDATIISAVIDAWAKSDSPRAADESLALLRQMQDYGVKADTTLFNSVINALSSCGERTSLDKAESILRDVEADPHLMADAFSYNTLLKAYSKRGYGDRAERLLQHWQREYMAGRTRARPDSYSFNGVIKSWLNSKQVKDAAARGSSILDWMESNQVPTSSFVTTRSSMVGHVIVPLTPLLRLRRYFNVMSIGTRQHETMNWSLTVSPTFILSLPGLREMMQDKVQRRQSITYVK